MSWQANLKKEARELKDYTAQIESRLKMATDRLTSISAGLHYAGETNEKWSEETKLRITAARGLEKMANLPLMKKPYSSNF